MKTISVPVRFEGIVQIQVDNTLPEKNSQVLAKKLALAKVLAGVNNPDSPDLDALDDYILETPDGKDEDWDLAQAVSIGGTWTTS